jgi:hypothetical protein
MKTVPIKRREFSTKALNAKLKSLNENPRIDKYTRIHPTTGDKIFTFHDTRLGFKFDFTQQESKFEEGKKYVNWGRVYGNEKAVNDFLTEIGHILYSQGGSKVGQLELDFLG